MYMSFFVHNSCCLLTTSVSDLAGTCQSVLGQLSLSDFSFLTLVAGIASASRTESSAVTATVRIAITTWSTRPSVVQRLR